MAPGRLGRLLAPKRIAVVGGGAWGAAVAGAAERVGFSGEITFVHPRGKAPEGAKVVTALSELEAAPDAVFLGINRHASVDAVAELRAMGAGGAVCFASGFTEAQAEDAGAVDLQARLVAAAGEMPILGPNCYGFVNALDGGAIWPDQHGMAPVARGVAVLTQSSNIAINLTMQQRALPLAMMITCGNMAQQSQARIATALLEDPRITALGLHVEGFGEIADWEALAEAARARGVPVVVLKVGQSAQARAATVSHTASLAGSDAGAQALLDRLGFARLSDLPSFLETLKLLHVAGPLPARSIGAISCSGGEASLMADMGAARGLEFPALETGQRAALRDALGPMVALANPLDYHTYIWRDVPAMTRAWGAMASGAQAMTLSVVDYPVTDASDWICATQAAIGAREASGKPFGVVASLPELMPREVAMHLMEGGVVPFNGMAEALNAVAAAARREDPDAGPALRAGALEGSRVMDEVEGKARLAKAGVHVPRHVVITPGQPVELAGLSGPFAVKGLGLAHKSDSGAVHLGITAEEVAATAADIGTDRVLVEQMVRGGSVELLVGVLRDPAHGFVLTLGAGGVLTEMLKDSVSLLVPSPPEMVLGALQRLRCWPLIEGYRGRCGVDMDALMDAISAVQRLVEAEASTLQELEINPLICGPGGAVAVDALIRYGGGDSGEEG
ncbi:acyl-CoA synthetase [Marinibacterium profundimaris]|uniref:Acyl-CoA synthetase n=1 Tax=Marinibacterium profundimaris TaxID=1679460 RepID=A0A225NPR4_9RHOB|nr:acyl-CoA synthetase [Marinibacterium profundimaris]